MELCNKTANWEIVAVISADILKLFYSLGFRTQAILTGRVKNENGVTENLVIMSHDRPMTA